MIVKSKLNKTDIPSPFYKAAADIEKETLSVDCELHIDCADELVQSGSEAKDVWGFNIYPDGTIDFVSLINIRPQDDNRGMEIEDAKIRNKIESIVAKHLV